MAMRRLALVTLLLCATSPAAARPGFYIGFGLGGTTAEGEDVPGHRLLPDPGTTLRPTMTYMTETDLEGGLSGLFTMGFNVLGYGAVETRVTGHGHDIDDPEMRSWSAHWHTGLRLYPLWHWQSLLPAVLQLLEPSLFMGWGLSYQGYAYDPASEVAWAQHGSMRLGAALEYFLISYFKVALDYSFTKPKYDHFYYDYGDGETFSVTPPARATFHQIYLLAAFQFGPPQEPVRYQPRPYEPDEEIDLEPRGAPAPAPAATDRAPGPVVPQPAQPAGEDDWI